MVKPLEEGTSLIKQFRKSCLGLTLKKFSHKPRFFERAYRLDWADGRAICWIEADSDARRRRIGVTVMGGTKDSGKR